MDKTKKMMSRIVLILLLGCCASTMMAQDVKGIQFCGKSLIGNDSLALHLKLTDGSGQALTGLSPTTIKQSLRILEIGDEWIDRERVTIKTISKTAGSQRIADDVTFSILVDQNIPDKKSIYQAVSELVGQAPDGAVYLSFYGDNVTSSQLVTKDNIGQFKDLFEHNCDKKYFYSAVYSKLAEFNSTPGEHEQFAQLQDGYIRNAAIGQRAKANPGHNFLFVFADGATDPEIESSEMDPIVIADYQAKQGSARIYSFYYTGSGQNEDMRAVLEMAAIPIVDGDTIKQCLGRFFPTTDISQALTEFRQTVNNEAYDYDYIFEVSPERVYNGHPVSFMAKWDIDSLGAATMTIGSVEAPWPMRNLGIGDQVMKYLTALLVAMLTFAFFFIVSKIIIPLSKSKSFELKYYKKYAPEANVTKRICHFCGREISPGQEVVTRCKHLMHSQCWQQNGYHCSEFGQNCNIGEQPHVNWNEMFTRRSLRDCNQSFAGILAALVAWVIYELSGRGNLFTNVAQSLTSWVLSPDHLLWSDCVNKTSAFLSIGLLLGVLLSFVFRYNDEYRQINAPILFKFIGLSLLSGVIGMVAFGIGGLILSFWAGRSTAFVLPWYYSLPAYLFFSIFFTLSLTIKSSIPVKSALLGGLLSAVIGFIVLYFSGNIGSQHEWMSMLLNLIIYGGGLGAALVTVRTLAEKYFLEFKNGIHMGKRIAIHKWMNSGYKVTMGMAGDCEIQMNWEKSNKVAKEHAQLYLMPLKKLPVIKPLTTGVNLNMRDELPVNRDHILVSGDTFKIGDTIFMYIELD